MKTSLTPGLVPSRRMLLPSLNPFRPLILLILLNLALAGCASTNLERIDGRWTLDPEKTLNIGALPSIPGLKQATGAMGAMLSVATLEFDAANLRLTDAFPLVHNTRPFTVESDAGDTIVLNTDTGPVTVRVLGRNSISVTRGGGSVYMKRAD